MVQRHRLGRPQMMFCGTLLGVGCLFSSAYRPVLVQGCSMSPTLRSGQVVLMERRQPRLHSSRPGDVVVFRHKREMCIKRVYATGGSVIQLARFDGGGTFLLETIGCPNKVRDVFRKHPSLGAVHEVRVPAGALFVVGDNYNVSDDSRDYGPIPESDVIGVVRSGLFDVRTSRTCPELDDESIVADRPSVNRRLAEASAAAGIPHRTTLLP